MARNHTVSKMNASSFHLLNKISCQTLFLHISLSIHLLHSNYNKHCMCWISDCHSAVLILSKPINFDSFLVVLLYIVEILNGKIHAPFLAKTVTAGEHVNSHEADSFIFLLYSLHHSVPLQPWLHLIRRVKTTSKSEINTQQRKKAFWLAEVSWLCGKGADE